jgi:ferredoxin
VDSSRCTGIGICQAICPEVFRVADGLARVRVDEVRAGDEVRCRLAADYCLAGAIELLDDAPAEAAFAASPTAWQT